MVRASLPLALLPSLSSATIHQRAWIDPATRSFRDEAGRHLILHGVNVVYKVDPYIPTDGAFDRDESLNDEDMADLQSWGINLVRLGVMWEGVEREPGVFDAAYLAKIDTLITKLGEKGIYTIVDAHQDVWSRSTCGEGIPNFYAQAALEKGARLFDGPGGALANAVLGPILRLAGYGKSLESYNMRKDEDGNYRNEDCLNATAVFSDFYTSPEALTIARALYNNYDGLQDRFIDFWRATSQSLAKNPHVIGFDPLNEPFASWGSVGQAISRILPGGFDRDVLAPLYARVHAANQEADSSSILLFEPAIFPDDNPFGTQKLGFKTPPGGEVGSAHHAVNSHTYCCEVASQSEACKSGEPGTTSKDGDICLDYHHENVGTRQAEAVSLGIPHLVSEFGACLDSEVCVREITQVADVCDEHLSSWAYWEFKKYKDITTSALDGAEGFYQKTNDGVQVGKVRAMARTYVRATQGTLLSQKFDSVSGNFEADMLVNTEVDAATEVHALQEGKGGTSWYPGGFDVVLVGPSAEELAPNQVEFVDDIVPNKVSFKIVDPSLSGHSITIKVKGKTVLV